MASSRLPNRWPARFSVMGHRGCPCYLLLRRFKPSSRRTRPPPPLVATPSSSTEMPLLLHADRAELKTGYGSCTLQSLAKIQQEFDDDNRQIST